MIIIFSAVGIVSAFYFRGFMKPVFIATITSPAIYITLLYFKDGMTAPLFFVAYFYLWNVSFVVSLLSAAMVKLIKIKTGRTG